MEEGGPSPFYYFEISNEVEIETLQRILAEGEAYINGSGSPMQVEEVMIDRREMGLNFDGEEGILILQAIFEENVNGGIQYTLLYSSQQGNQQNDEGSNESFRSLMIAMAAQQRSVGNLNNFYVVVNGQQIIEITPSTCPLCYKTFCSMSARNRHIQTHFGNHKCGACGACWNSKTSLTKHICIVSQLSGS